MTDEERQRMMDFILQQQAQFAVDIQKLQEAQAAHEKSADKRMSNLETGFVKLYNLIDDTARLTRENSIQIAETNANLKETNERLEETNERLNAFIFVLETGIASRKQNGNNAKKQTSRRAAKKKPDDKQ